MRKITVVVIVLFAWLAGCKHEIINPGGIDSHPDSTGTGPGGSICFETDVLPIFQSNCAKSGCHNASSAEEGYVLDSYNNIMRKGIKPNNAADSKIYKVLFESGDKKMPQSPNPPLDLLQINRIAQWINEGAINSTGCNTTCDTSKYAFTANVFPIFKNYCNSCHSTTLQNGGVDLSNYAGVKKAVALIPDAIQFKLNATKNMPQGGTKMPDCNIDVILKWIKAGAPQN